MKKIESLTNDQVARMADYVRNWTDIGLSTEPADRKRAEAGINKAYECAGLPAPKSIVWCGSPLSAGLTRAFVFGMSNSEIAIKPVASVGDSVRASVRDSVWASVWDSVGASVGDSVWDSVRDSVGASVGDSVWDSVRDSVRDSVWDSVRDSVWASVRDSVRDSVWASVGASCYGQHEANWLAFYQYFRDVCGLNEQTQKLAGHWEVSQSAGWWLPHQNICWISERHNILNRNSRGQLHCDSGPSLSYPDGFMIWAIDGVRVDEQVVMRPESQTVEQIDSEENSDIRSIRIDRFGWAKYLKQTSATCRHERKNEVDGTSEALYRTKHGSQRLVVTCQTGRLFAIGVPDSIETCEQAQNWLGGGTKRKVIAAT